MTDQIVTRASMRKRGADAFNAGRSRESHNMNWHSPALAEWLEGYDEAAQAWHRQLRQQQQARVVVAEVSPP